MRTASVACLAAAVFLADAPAAAKEKDPPSYPEGVSVQTVDDHSFDLVAPKAAEAKPPYSLLLVVAGAGTLPEQFVPLAKEGWVVVLPRQRFSGGMWATSETKDIQADLDAVAAAFSVAKERMHCLGIHDSRGFATFVAFGKGQAFASASFAESEWTGLGNAKSLPSDAKKRLGILLLGENGDTAAFGDPVKIVAGLADKVRTAEYRHEDDPFKPYFRYWLAVMDGRFEPGRDLSFAWIEDARPAPAAKPGAKDAPRAAAQNALDSGKASAKAKGAAAFVYFWSADDAENPAAKALQNDVFLQIDVRAAAKPLVAVKLERAKYDAAFAGFGLKATPAVVVVDQAFAVVETFEGPIAAKTLAKAFAKAAAAAAKPK